MTSILLEITKRIYYRFNYVEISLWLKVNVLGSTEIYIVFVALL